MYVQFQVNFQYGQVVHTLEEGINLHLQSRYILIKTNKTVKTNNLREICRSLKNINTNICCTFFENNFNTIRKLLNISFHWRRRLIGSQTRLERVCLHRILLTFLSQTPLGQLQDGHVLVVFRVGRGCHLFTNLTTLLRPHGISLSVSTQIYLTQNQRKTIRLHHAHGLKCDIIFFLYFGLYDYHSQK